MNPKVEKIKIINSVNLEIRDIDKPKITKKSTKLKQYV